jgi:hypothetical protein
MKVKASMPARQLNLVLPLAHEATETRIEETTGSAPARSCAAAPLIGADRLRPGDVNSKHPRSSRATTPTTRTSATATRTTTTSPGRTAARGLSADSHAAIAPPGDDAAPFPSTRSCRPGRTAAPTSATRRARRPSKSASNPISGRCTSAYAIARTSPVAAFASSSRGRSRAKCGRPSSRTASFTTWSTTISLRASMPASSPAAAPASPAAARSMQPSASSTACARSRATAAGARST